MRSKIKITIILLFLAITSFSIVPTTKAQEGILKETKKTEFNNNLNTFADQAAIERQKSLEEMIGTAIRVVLTALGTIFIAMMFVAGNTWMQAAGNEEKIKKSQERIRSLIIGLIIVLIAYALSAGFSGLLSRALLK
ncbi:MAG: hypothetical protein WCT50_02230 [Patescibacteria group bacterium]|jgi:uncharacterized membrane protein YwzB